MVFQGLKWTTTLIMFFFFFFFAQWKFLAETRGRSDSNRAIRNRRSQQSAAVRMTVGHQLWNFTAVCPNGRFRVNTQLLWVEDVWGHRQRRPECLVSSGCQWNLKAWHRRLEPASISLWCHEKGSELGSMFLRSYSRNPFDAGNKGSRVKHSNMYGIVFIVLCCQVQARVISGT